MGWWSERGGSEKRGMAVELASDDTHKKRHRYTAATFTPLSLFFYLPVFAGSRKFRV